MIKKFIASKTLTINGRPSPCECEDHITCAYCVQANLLSMKKKFTEGDEAVKATIETMRKNGIRKTARQIGEDEKTLRRWIQTKNIPSRGVDKIAELRT
jgi:hypothetical protein